MDDSILYRTARQHLHWHLGPAQRNSFRFSNPAMNRASKCSGRLPSPASQSRCRPLGRKTEAALLTGGQDRHYAVALAVALANEKVRMDVIGSDEIDGPELHDHQNLTFINLRGDT